MDDTDLRSAFATLLSDEPPLPTVADQLRAGQRQRSRRRVTAGLGALAVVGVLGAGYGVATAGTTTATTPAAPTSSPTAPPTPTPTVVTEYDQPDGPEDQARIRGFELDHADGTVTPAAGVTVLDTIVHEVGRGSGTVSVAVLNHGQEHWYRLSWGRERDGSLGVESEIHGRAGEEDQDTFVAWDAAAQALADLPDPDPRDFPAAAVTTDRWGAWTLADGVTLVDEIDNPFGLRAPYTSAALTLRDETGVRDWVLTPGGASSRPHTGPGSLQALADRTVGPSMSVSGPMPDLVRSGPGSMPVVVDGVEVLATVENPLGLRAPRRSVAYELRGEGRTWWLLWERGRSGLLIAETTRVAGDGYADLASWLADQKPRAAW